MYYVCIDIGGTSIKYGVADETGNFQDTGVIATEVLEKGIQQMLQKVIQIIDHYKSTYALRGAAISTAGIVEPDTGEILYAADHFPDYTGTKLKELIEEACGLPCSVENDVNAAGLGEYWQGAGQKAASLFCLTVGTGVGGCVIIDGKLLHGASNSAGEVGYLKIGGSATLEESASVSALVRTVAAAKHIPVQQLDGRKIFRMAKSGDAIAVTAIDRMVDHLAAGIANVCYVLNPQVVIIGGGIMSQKRYLKPRIIAALQKKVLAPVFSRTRLSFARLQNEAGMTGALYHFLQQEEGRRI
jgi:predicted NBD/HSP70 family sugar kinase